MERPNPLRRIRSRQRLVEALCIAAIRIGAMKIERPPSAAWQVSDRRSFDAEFAVVNVRHESPPPKCATIRPRHFGQNVELEIARHNSQFYQFAKCVT
jgi:hypothetical protein